MAITDSPAADPNSTDPTRELPTRAQVRAAVPDDCFVRDTARSMRALLGSAVLVAAMVAVAWWLPTTWAWAPAWIAYAVACGTAATGLWVIAHECGHEAFSANARLQDTVGFVLHSLLLVPYFSWQRSHSVHHARTNHLDEGETHVPRRVAARPHRASGRAGRRGTVLTWSVLVRTLLFGWPAYLLVGVTGAPARGRSNHFWPIRPFAGDLFPQRWHRRVWASTAGVSAVVAALVALGVAVGPSRVALVYLGPYVVVNAWLVAYTWLQHTDVDVPHYAEPEWSWMLGALQTVDRPYGRVVDALHHRIGSTHVAHHIDHRIPHYHAARATDALRTAFPAWYRHDPTPVPRALWRVARDCVAVERTDDGWRFAPDRPTG